MDTGIPGHASEVQPIVVPGWPGVRHLAERKTYAI